MDELKDYRRELISALERDVEELTRRASNLPADQWQRTPGNAFHTPHYILYRLLALESHEFAIQIRRILEEDLPRLDAFDVDAWMVSRYSADESIQAMLGDFSGLRSLEAGQLLGLSSTSWSRFGRHPQRGMHTLQWWVELQHAITGQHLNELSR